MASVVPCCSPLQITEFRRNIGSFPRRKAFFSNRRKNCWMIARASITDGPALLQAAKHTVDTYIRSGMVVGLGSGHASSMAIQYLGRKIREGALKDVIGIPTSVSSASEAAKAGILLNDYQNSSQIDFSFSDADIIEEGTLISLIGRRKLQGGESIIQEKSIIKDAGELVFIVTEKQYKGVLDGSIPVIVHAYNWMETAEEIDDLFLGDAEDVEVSKILGLFFLGGEEFAKKAFRSVEERFDGASENNIKEKEEVLKGEIVPDRGQNSEGKMEEVVRALNIVRRLKTQKIKKSQ
ncbi:PREDICTED: probable ribose-5-phosphate isomerase 4, chloroplastic [Nelumbo nucifera]|uniref:ribose-5-phosphate isomerase n=1 Tax=Nelumbo nucifera TaxID=4432 RepID=A0A1U8Q1U6_NELNU|nr:PREDICTED: probable ribose-5-phosphate isomerase 4, chloroplastic [Nelumbo nucifera]